MNKAELINAIAAEAGLSKVDARKALDAVVKSVSDVLIAGDKVSLVGFGTFQLLNVLLARASTRLQNKLLLLQLKKLLNLKPVLN